MKEVMVRITRVGVYEDFLYFDSIMTDEEIRDEIEELAFEVEDDIELDSEIEYSVKEVSE